MSFSDHWHSNRPRKTAQGRGMLDMTRKRDIEAPVHGIRIAWPGLIKLSASIADGINTLRSASLFVGAHKTTIAIFRATRFC
jgi:hypothetical protein